MAGPSRTPSPPTRQAPAGRRRSWLPGIWSFPQAQAPPPATAHRELCTPLSVGTASPSPGTAWPLGSPGPGPTRSTSQRHELSVPCGPPRWRRRFCSGCSGDNRLPRTQRLPPPPGQTESSPRGALRWGPHADAPAPLSQCRSPPQTELAHPTPFLEFHSRFCLQLLPSHRWPVPHTASGASAMPAPPRPGCTEGVPSPQGCP